MRLILYLFFLASCSSTMLQDPNVRPKFAPADYVQKGRMKYLNEGAGHLIASRREDAFEKMHRARGGDYRITYEALENDKYWQNVGYGMYNSEYMIIEFVCQEKTASK